MQSVLMQGEMPAQELESLVSDMPVAPHPRRWRTVGAVSLALVLGTAIVGVTIRSRPASPSNASYARLDAVIQRAEEAPKCLKEDDECKGCSGAQCSGCRATVGFNCCMAKAESGQDKAACCSNEDFKLAKKGDACKPQCLSADDECKGCSGAQCSGCRATVGFNCCMAKAESDDDKAACCSNEDFKLAKKNDACNTDAKLTASSRQCSKAGDGCRHTGCCQQEGLTCFVKNYHWADCKKSCEPGKVDPNSPKDQQSPWSCDLACSKAGEGCMKTGCCQDPSLRCFKKNEHWADCKKTCEPGKVDPNSPKDQQSPWSCDPMCSKAGAGCLKTGCCADPDLKCFLKNEHWADCKKTCEPGKVDPNSPKDQQSPWNCTVLKATS